MATFVLVHGAWHGGWCWRRVADRLTANGHHVFRPTLTGVGERSHLLNPDIDLDTQITDVVNVMKWEGLTDVVLCGHSYGGFVISGVAEKMESAISSIVYVDAFLPDDGMALIDYVGSEQRQRHLDQARDGVPTPPNAAEFFAVNERDRAWVDSQCTPHPAKCFVQKPSLPGARDRIARKTYVFASGWNGHFGPFRDKAENDPSWRVIDVPCGHDIMIDMPERLAEIFEEVA